MVHVSEIMYYGVWLLENCMERIKALLQTSLRSEKTARI